MKDDVAGSFCQTLAAAAVLRAALPRRCDAFRREQRADAAPRGGAPGPHMGKAQHMHIVRHDIQDHLTQNIGRCMSLRAQGLASVLRHIIGRLFTQ